MGYIPSFADGALRNGREVHPKARSLVEHVRIRRTDDKAYPSGWDYALHYGTIDGETLLRYDKAHERSKGHERHTGDDVERIDFPGMSALLERFQREVDDLRRRSVPTTTSEPPMTEPTTLTVRLGDGEQVRREAPDRIRDLERGTSVEDRHVLVLDEAEALQRLFRPTTLELLAAIRKHEPESMRDAAALVDRDFKEVHRNLTELEALAVVELEEDGRSKRPIVRFDEIDVEVSLTDGESDVAPA